MRSTPGRLRRECDVLAWSANPLGATIGGIVVERYLEKPAEAAAA